MRELHESNPRTYTIEQLASAGEVSKQSYYKWLNRTETANDQLNEVLMGKIKELDKKHHHNLGVQRMTMYLNRDEEIDQRINPKRVRRLMHIDGIRADIRKKRHNRIKANEMYITDNVMNQDFTTSSPNEKWATDMTELRYGRNLEHALKLSAVIDLYGTYVLSFNVSETETTSAAIQTFEQAYQSAGNPEDVLVHSDRGAAYTSGAFQNYLGRHNARRSMSRPGTPYDNAIMEKFWNDFKVEWWDKQHSYTYEEAVEAIKAGIDYFNLIRRSETINSHTPEEFRNMAIYGGISA
ncbi:IS3 family transposase [Weissella confusa]|nr:IS3 family transposase [Weissella confusa]MBJ7695674.1 IS3 family transposase [Weissella confusa]